MGPFGERGAYRDEGDDERAALIEPHIPALRRYAWALCRSAQDPDDLVQDCLVSALGAWRQRRDDNVRAWLFTILHNRFISDRRQEARRPQGDEELAEDAMTTDAAQENTVVLNELAEAMQKLPEEQRTVMLLVGVENMAYEEAARILNIPIGTVMSRLFRARESLRRAVDGEARVALRRVK